MHSKQVLVSAVTVPEACFQGMCSWVCRWKGHSARCLHLRHVLACEKVTGRYVCIQGMCSWVCEKVTIHPNHAFKANVRECEKRSQSTRTMHLRQMFVSVEKGHNPSEPCIEGKCSWVWKKVTMPEPCIQGKCSWVCEKKSHNPPEPCIESKCSWVWEKFTIGPNHTFKASVRECGKGHNPPEPYIQGKCSWVW